jgi:DME family drug/metabolite transporter
MLLALVLGVVGTGFVLTGPSGGLDSIEGRSGWGGGIALALVAGLCFGTENVVVRRLMRRHDPMQLAALTTIASVWLLAPLALPRGGIVRASLDGWPWLLYLSVFPTALAPVLHNAGLKRVSAISAGIVGLLEPLTAATVGLLVFHEALGLMGGLGAALLLLAIALLYVSQRTALQETATVSASAAEPLSSDDA